MIGNGALSQSVLSTDGQATISSTPALELIKLGKFFTVQLLLTVGTMSSKYVLCDPSTIVPNPPSFIGNVIAFPIRFVSRGGESDSKIYVGGNYAGGTTIIPINRNGQSSIVAQTSCKLDPTGSNKGTMVFPYITGADAQAFVTGGGENSQDYPLIFNTAQKYLLEINNTNGSAIDIEIRMHLAEF